METFLLKAAQLILALAILVIIHEFGHFLFARMFGIRVEKFYIFFNPWISLFKWFPKRYARFCKKNEDVAYPEDEEQQQGEETDATGNNLPAKKKRKPGFWNNTEYGLGWLPLGGYCKISGMIDESMDKEQMAKPPQPWEFRSHPAWQRLLVMIAGVLFNFLLAIVIYAGIVWATGEKYVPFREAKMGMAFSPAAQKAGFRDGDIPLTADGEPLVHPGEGRLMMLQAKEVQVVRDGRDTVTVKIPKDLIFQVDKEMKDKTSTVNFMAYRMPVKITQVAPGEGAAKAGLKEGDRIISIDSVKTPTLDVFFPTLEGHSNRTVTLGIVRGNDTIAVPVQLNASSKMGIGLDIDPADFYKVEEKHYNIFQSIPRGITMGVDKLTSYAESMKLVFTKEGAQSIGGFGAIGSIFPTSWDWIAFWNIAAFLSVALAFMNILPIPALDGGHVLFLLYEVITRRKPSEKFMEWAQMIGMGLLLLLLVYANGMDIVRLFK